MQKILGIAFDVGIDDDDELASTVDESAHHRIRIREVLRVPGEVALAVCVLDVQPHDVHRHAVGVKALGDGQHVRLVVVVPAGLVVAQREYLKIFRAFLFNWQAVGPGKYRVCYILSEKCGLFKKKFHCLYLR